MNRYDSNSSSTYAKMPDKPVISATIYAIYAYINTTSGSSTGVRSVNFVMKTAMKPKKIPTTRPPMNTTKNETTARTKSVGIRLFSPILRKLSNIR